MTAITSILSLAIGVGVGIMRLSNGRIRSLLASIYIEVHRNVPALVLIIFWAFAFPNLFPLELRRNIFFQNEIIYGLELLTGISVPYYAFAAGLALTLNTSAYIAELFRAGVGTIPQQHVDAYRTFGATKRMVLKQIIIPQGLIAASPAITTRLIHHMKNTTLAALVSTPEFFHSIQAAITRSFQAVEFLTLAALVFLALSTAYSYLLKWFEKRLMTEAHKEGANLHLQRLLVE
jgi:polar amino acid transport system permease protein